MTPALFIAVSLPYFSRFSRLYTSARMKPRSKSVWMTPAHFGAFQPLWKVQARISFGPAVK